MAQKFSTALVIGASSGIGEALVRQLVAAGTTVAAVARREAELRRVAESAGADKVKIYVHDVRDFGATPALFERIVADMGGLDLVVYNAGVMPEVAESEYSFEKDRLMVEVNLLGAMAWFNPAGAYMEARRAGTLAGISSVAGDRGRRGAPVYTASKAGFTAYLEALRNRLDRYGVSVVTVKPGPVDTAMTAGKKLPLLIDVERCAHESLGIIRGGTGVGYVPAIWGPIMLLIQHIPSIVFRRTNI